MPDLTSQFPSEMASRGDPVPQTLCPWEVFDAEWYAATHMRRPGGPAEPFAHYSEIGVASGFGPNRYFDENWYVRRYGDVADLVRRGAFASGFAHYCAIGHTTKDPHWLFDEALYRQRRTDLTDSVLVDVGLRNGYHHYLIAGQNEKVSGSPFFDPAMFAEATGIAHQPYTALLGTPELAALTLSRYFDPDWYLAMYEDAAVEVAFGR